MVIGWSSSQSRDSESEYVGVWEESEIQGDLFIINLFKHVII